MKCLVTGAAGFIGSHLVDYLLLEGHSVLGIDNFSSGSMTNLEIAMKNPLFEFKELDISSISQTKKIVGEYDYVFHLAALAEIVPSIQNPNAYFESNVIGTYNTCQLARELSVKKFVYAASSSCYGIPDYYPTHETAQSGPQYPYALTKYLGEQIVMHWSKVYRVPAISLRLFNVYGPRARTSGSYGAVMGVFLAQMLAGVPLTIVGDGQQKRDFTFVSDVINAFYAAAISNIRQDIFNVGSGNPRKVIDLAKMISDKELVFVPKRPGEPDQTFADISKIQKHIGWKPLIDLEQGIARILESSAEWANAPVWTPEKISKATSDWFKYLSVNDD